uniref:Dynein regulatory complex protein 1 n=1 Tax=Chrysemys picta bellii TaxID=8478 RepID=A0A8C3FVD7_CHRPI
LTPPAEVGVSTVDGKPRRSILPPSLQWGKSAAIRRIQLRYSAAAEPATSPSCVICLVLAALCRLEKLENESKTNQDKFEEITSKWGSAKEKTIPQDLWDVLNLQQQQRALLIEEKNKLISELQQELKSKDDQYVKDLKKQSDDINLLVERMEEQIRNLMKTYRRELTQIEVATGFIAGWEQAVNYSHDKSTREFSLMELSPAKGSLAHYTGISATLGSGFRCFCGPELSLCQVEVKLEMNGALIETFMHVTFIGLGSEGTSLWIDYSRIIRPFPPCRHFAVIDAQKFLELWLMNEEEAKGLVWKALEADRVIHTQQLGLPWVEPDSWFLDNVGPIVHRKAIRSASKLAQEVMALTEAEAEAGEEVKPPRHISVKSVKHILELLCDESGFLIETKLLGLLQPLERHERSLMRLDAIFAALEIDNEDDVYMLVDFFLTFKAQQVVSSQTPGRRWGLLMPALSQAMAPPFRPGGVTERMGRARPQVKKVMEERDNSKDSEYWEALAHVIPEPKLKVWDALEAALEKYYSVLSQRAKLLTDLDGLQQQNTELHMLLHQYVTSKVSGRAGTSLGQGPGLWELPSLAVGALREGSLLRVPEALHGSCPHGPVAVSKGEGR